MLLEILIIIIIVCILTTAGAIWFASHAVKTAIRESKPNVTINLNQPKEESILKELPEIMQKLLALPIAKEVKKIERKADLQNSEKGET